MGLPLNIITDMSSFLSNGYDYYEYWDDNIISHLEALKDSPLSIDTFSFYISVSAVFSSKIEGEDIELDSYIKHKRFGAHFQADHTRKIDDLYDAYLFAQNNTLNEPNLMQAHTILTRHILQPSKQGKLRTGNMYVITQDGNIEYVAALPAKVPGELSLFFKDLDLLLNTQLAADEVFYYAAMLHLVFVKIHPFEDGNGRMARLLEKWFLAQKLGRQAWLIESEKYYYTHHNDYYKHIRALWLEYDTLNYYYASGFLRMLPGSLTPPEE